MRRPPSRRTHLIVLFVLSFSLIVGMAWYAADGLSLDRTDPPVRYALGASLGTTPVRAGVKQLTVQSAGRVHWFVVETAHTVPLDATVYAECAQGQAVALVAGEARMPILRGDALDLCRWAQP